MEKRKKIELRSDEVQEILATPPSWIVRWGSFCMALVLGILVWVCWNWEYADEVSGSLVLTTTNPPQMVLAKTDGTVVRLLTKDGAKVEQGDILAVMQNHANYDHVNLLSEQLDSMQILKSFMLNTYRLPEDLELGDLQKSYAELKRYLKEFQQSNLNATDLGKIKKYKQQIAEIDQEIEYVNQQTQTAINQKKLRLETRKKLQKDYLNGVATQANLAQSWDGILDIEKQIKSHRKEISEKEREKQALEIAIKDIEKSAVYTNQDKLGLINQSMENLSTEIDLWRMNYILRAPVAGTVVLDGYWKAHQFMRRGEPVMAILTDREEEIIGKAEVPLEFAGRVAPGQIVHLKLASYPAHRYGFLYGTVVEKIRHPQSGTYTVTISLDNGMISATNESLIFEPGMIGEAEIVTEKRNVLQRLFGQASRLLFGEG